MTDFNPRSPDGERLAIWSRIDCNTDISIHAPRMGSDEASAETCAWYKPFQSTLPGWGATICSSQPLISLNDFNPRSPDGERPPLRHAGTNVRGISIHAPRMGSDLDVCTTYLHRYKFQSTLPGWGATRLVSICRPRRHFNPRSPDGERRRQIFTVPKSQRFQSTLPGWGATLSLSISARCSRIFQSTLPGWGATIANDFPTLETNFNPRSPDGERQGAQDGANWIDAFQSTLPGWGATVISMFFGIIITIFQSTLPGWGATCYAVACNRSIEFQSTLPGWGATKRGRETRGVIEISIHAPRMGSDPTMTAP